MNEISAQTNQFSLAKNELPKSGLRLERRSQSGSFYDVVGRKSALLGYEHKSAEAWVYPLKVLDQFDLGFRLEGYPLEFRASSILTNIEVLPEATIFTYSHAAFTVRQIVFAPLDEAAIVMLLDVDSVLPMTVSATFKPKMRLMWLAGSMTPGVEWNSEQKRYYLTEETGKLVGVIGSPLARDASVMPYQEEPQDVPNQFLIETSAEVYKRNYIPIIIAASANNRAEARQTYDKVLASIPELYAKNVEHYKKLETDFVQIKTPDERLNRAFAWAKVGVDKGLATNPTLGTGLLAGFRTSGESERPGFAWFFGRDALWTSFATNSYGDFATSKTALEFLRKFQRADGKIPHEISQSADYVDWFNKFPYAWAAADATPLYVVACWDYYKASGDAEFLKASWDSIQKAYKFTAATDTDKNGLVENTKVGHGWIEGGALYPPHEEIYQQAMWFAAAAAMSEIAFEMRDKKLAKEAREAAEKSRIATESTFWLADKNIYAYATKLPTEKPATAESGANKTVRQSRLNELAAAKMFDENTVLPAVPMWFRMLDDARAQKALDEIGSAKIATDWGARILANDSRLYDPLSYHNGSVWGLFTGWASVAAYNYGRQHTGFQAVYANAQLKESNQLGYITELLSGDYNQAFGRSSHHQIWSEAMIATPVLRGMFGVEIKDKTLRVAPALPADWLETELKNVRFETAKYDFKFSRENGKLTVNVQTNNKRIAQKLRIAPAFPFNAVVKNVLVNGKTAQFNLTKIGDVQRAEVLLENFANVSSVVFELDEGAEVFYKPQNLQIGQRNQDLKIIRATADAGNLRLIVEGLGGRTYTLGVRSGFKLDAAENVQIEQNADLFGKISIKFDGASNAFVRREIVFSSQRK